MERNYAVIKVYKSGTRRIVEKNLTRDEAKRRVQRDQEENPKATKYMLVFDKVN